MSFFKDFLQGAAETGGEILDERRQLRQVNDMKKADDIRKIDTDTKIYERKSEIDAKAKAAEAQRSAERDRLLIAEYMGGVGSPTSDGKVDVPGTSNRRDSLFNLRSAGEITGNKAITGLAKSELDRLSTRDKVFDRNKGIAKELPTDKSGKTPVVEFQEWFDANSEGSSSALANELLGLDVSVNLQLPGEQAGVAEDIKLHKRLTKKAISDLERGAADEYGVVQVLSDDIREDALALSRLRAKKDRAILQDGNIKRVEEQIVKTTMALQEKYTEEVANSVLLDMGLGLAVPAGAAGTSEAEKPTETPKYTPGQRANINGVIHKYDGTRWLPEK